MMRLDKQSRLVRKDLCTREDESDYDNTYEELLQVT